MKFRSVILKIVLPLVLLIAILFGLQRLVEPKYVDDIIEGAFISEFYKQEDKSFDVVMFGDCEVYENYSPAKMWREYGINSYIRGSAQQYIFQSYYLMEDTLKYVKPKVILFNVLSMRFDKAQTESYNRMSLEGMKWSKSKVDAINASMMEDEHFVDYVFPILRYHSRISELNKNDFKYYFDSPFVSYNGYYMRVDIKAAEGIPPAKPLADYSFGDNSWKYLDKMRELCEKNGIQFILIKAPSLYPTWYDQYEEQIEEYANKYDIPYYNFRELADDIGLDYSVDTYDAGIHMNLTGAEKMSVYLGKILQNEYGVPDRSGDEKLSNIWDEKLKTYDDEIARQKKLYGME